MRLILFDCDGTLVDSQATIVACAQAAFAAEGLPVPTAHAVRRIVGLSLAEAMAGLLTPPPDARRAGRLAEGYRAAFLAHRASAAFHEPLFPGARALLDELRARGYLLGVATGKAMRGLRSVLERHGLQDHFATLQTADRHPSKPHPAMVRAALDATGCGAAEAMLVGDTSFDVLMAVAAGVTPVGVSWGNHPPAELTAAGAVRVLGAFDELHELLPREGPTRPSVAHALRRDR